MWNFSSLWANMVKYDMCEAIVTDDDDVDRCGVSSLVNFFNDMWTVPGLIKFK